VTLQARVLIGLTAIAVVLAGLGLAVTRVISAELVGQVDDRLAATDLRAPDPGGFRDPFGRFGGGFGDDDDDDRPEPPSSTYVAVVDADGDTAVLYRPTVGDEVLPDLDGEEALEAAEEREPYTVDTEDGGRYRLLAREVSGGALVVGLSLEDVDDTMARLVTLLAVGGAVTFAVLGLVGWWVIRLGVRPVKEMAEVAGEIGGGDLATRVPEADPRTEAGRLGQALNRMLGRIEDELDRRRRSEDRLRQFAADASHELRTPVTTVRGYAELYRAGGLRDEAALTEAMGRVEAETVRMGSLVEDLLALARLDQGQELALEPVDLAVLARDAAADAAAVAPDRTVTVAADGPVVVNGDDRRLRQVVANLVTNALVHTTGAVRLRVAGQGDRAVLEVADDGPGMTPEVAERVFERFYRADPARSRDRGGSGLGLAIVAAVVAAHHGTVTVTSDPASGSTFRVEL